MTTAPPAPTAALLPDDDDRRSFARHGYWISPTILPDEVLDAAERGMARFYAGDHDAPFPGPDGVDRSGGWQPGDAGLRKNDYASLRVRELAALVRHPMIGATAAALTGAATIRLWHDQLLYKPGDPGPGGTAPGGTNVGWHTDRQYWQSCTSPRMLTAWVPFHDVDETTGSITFVDGSHRWDVAGLDFFDQQLDGLDEHLRRSGHTVRRHPAVLRRGQVSFHDAGTVHGSGPNRSTAPRRSLAVHLQPGDNRHRHHTLPDGTPAGHFNDGLVRRTPSTDPTAPDSTAPDYTDPAICPTLWSTAWTATPPTRG